jgi:hypothetical protein
MTLLVASDHATELCLYTVGETPDPMSFDTPDYLPTTVEVFEPNWAAIEATEFLDPYINIFKTCFTDANTRTSADDVIRYLLVSEGSARKER